MTEPHSAPYFCEERDFWWNADFLELMAKRWQLQNVHSLLDVGCGVGHWGRLLSRFLADNAKVTGIDREPEWIEKSSEYAHTSRGEFAYVLGSAEEIPFADATFDMVTCQTVLLHVKDAKEAIQEMLRVLKPGGLLAVIEPNNIASELIFDTSSATSSVEDILKLVQFHLYCERGAEKLGIGSGSVGDVIPHYFADFGLIDIKVYVSDKACSLFPPYARAEDQVSIKQMKEWYEDDLLLWQKEETQTYFLAGGGNASDFETGWNLLKARVRKQIEAIENHTYSTAGGGVFYLISGRKA